MRMSRSRSLLPIIYLTFAIAGGILTAIANFQFVQDYGPGFDILRFVELANNNPASQSLSRDLIIGAGAITVWIISESRRLKMKNLWIVIFTMFTIAFAFAAPLFLFLRERRLLELEANTTSDENLKNISP